MYKSFVVSLAIIMFVSFNSLNVTAAAEVNKCIALFLKTDGLPGQSSRSSGSDSSPSNPLTVSLIERLVIKANESKSKINEAELAAKVLRLAEGLYNRYGQRIDQLPNNHPNTKLIRSLVKFYIDQLIPLTDVFEKNRAELKSVLGKETADIIEMFADEQAQLVDEVQRRITTSAIRHTLYSTSNRVGNLAVIEIHGGPAIVSKLTSMYTRYSEKNGWKVKQLHSDDTGMTLEVSGDHALTQLSLDSGKHRLYLNDNNKTYSQEATVQIFKPIEEASIDPAAVKRDIVFKSVLGSGPGGQAVQKNETAVRAVHKPTGIQIKVQIERSQEANKRKAVGIIYGKLKDLADQQQRAELNAARLSSARGQSALRFPYTRLYRLDENAQVAMNIFDGNIEVIIENQLFKAQVDQIESLIHQVETGHSFNGR